MVGRSMAQSRERWTSRVTSEICWARWLSVLLHRYLMHLVPLTTTEWHSLLLTWTEYFPLIILCTQTTAQEDSPETKQTERLAENGVHGRRQRHVRPVSKRAPDDTALVRAERNAIAVSLVVGLGHGGFLIIIGDQRHL